MKDLLDRIKAFVENPPHASPLHLNNRTAMADIVRLCVGKNKEENATSAFGIQPLDDSFITQASDESHEAYRSRLQSKLSSQESEIIALTNYITSLSKFLSKFHQFSSHLRLDPRQKTEFQKRITALHAEMEQLRYVLQENSSELTDAIQQSEIPNFATTPKVQAVVAADTTLKNGVIVRYFTYSHQERLRQTQFFGMHTGGHLSLEIIKEGKPPLYISFATDNTDRQDVENTAVERAYNVAAHVAHLPRAKNKTGVFLSKEEDRQNTLGATPFYSSVKRVSIDCDPSLGPIPIDLDAIYDKAEQLLAEPVPAYNFLTNNCSNVVTKLVESGVVDRSVGSAPRAIVTQTTTPLDSFKHFEQVAHQVHHRQVENTLRANWTKPETNALWQMRLDFTIDTLAVYEPRLINFLTKLNEREIPLISKDELITKLEQQNNPENLLQTILTALMAFNQALSKPDANLENLLEDLYFVCSKAIDLISKMSAAELPNKNNVLLTLEWLTQQTPAWVKNIFQMENRETKVNLNILVAQEFRRAGGEYENFMHAYYYKDNPFPPEPLVGKNYKDEEILKAALDLEDSYGDIDSERIDYLKTMVEQFNTDRRLDAYPANDASFKTFKGDPEKAQKLKKQRSAAVFVTMQNAIREFQFAMQGQSFNSANSESVQMQTILRLENAVLNIERLQSERKGNLPSNAFFDQLGETLRSALGKAQSYLFFDRHASPTPNEANLLFQVATLIDPALIDPRHTRVGLLLTTAPSIFKRLNPASYSELSKETKDKLAKEEKELTTEGIEKIEKPSVLNPFSWKERHQLFEIETQHQVQKILESKEHPGIKLDEVRKITKKNRPNWLQRLWRGPEYERYQELTRKAELVCLVEALHQGHIDLQYFCGELKAHAEKYSHVENYKAQVSALRKNALIRYQSVVRAHEREDKTHEDISYFTQREKYRTVFANSASNTTYKQAMRKRALLDSEAPGKISHRVGPANEQELDELVKKDFQLAALSTKYEK